MTGHSDSRLGDAENTKERVYRLLRADIVKGALDMGQKLNERELALKYEVSKTPVREALNLLQQEGLVEVVPRVGYLTSRITFQDVDDIFDLRQIMETAAAERAAVNIQEEDLQRLEQLHSAFHPDDRESYCLFLDENVEFHRVIALASGNQRLVDAIVRLLEQMQRLIVLRLGPSISPAELVEQHRQLVAALRERDPVRAREEMARDIANSYQVVTEVLRKRSLKWHI